MSNRFQNLILNKDNTIVDAIMCLNKSGKQIIFICDKKNKLLGTITDGDIRKFLIKKIDLETPLKILMNTDPVVANDSNNQGDIIAKLRHFNIRSIPLVNKNKELIDVFFYNDFLKINQTRPAMLIMAGGYGTRMGNLTKETPKPMLKVAGKPILQKIIEKAAEEKFEKIFISVHHLAEKIQNYFKNGEDFGIKIEYLHEKTPLGTGGSFKLLQDVDGPILVTNADILSNINYQALIDFHSNNTARATIATRTHKIQHQFGVVETTGIDFVSFQEKPEWVTTINAGIYVVNSDVTHLIAPNEVVSMPEIIQRVKDDGGRVLVYPLYENWVDLGSPEQYASYR